MSHLWLRAETRDHEKRVGLTPQGAAKLIATGMQVTVEDSAQRIIPTAEYAQAGCAIVDEGAWPDAPEDAIIFGLKELPEDGKPLRHNHIMFGHAYKGQPAGKVLLDRFKAGGGVLYDLEYLTDDIGRRVAAFGYWAGYAGAAVALKCWIAGQSGALAAPVHDYPSANHLLMDLQQTLMAQGTGRPTALIIGALGRVGTGAADLCQAMGVATTKWDIAETAHGGPFPEVLAHDIFLNCILARPGTPVFVPTSAETAPRSLSVIGDIACDPDSDFSPI
ncbi:MAG: saccharopine dehydrogenase, partial [Pseudomonadota bacterium]